ncbi:MAG: AI-2E family transporter [Moraxella sp.]|nr:AI-2E family transporter [Moraxella sp.]
MQIFRLDPFFKRFFILLALLVSCYALYLMKPVIIPFVAAFFLAYLLNPVVSYLNKYMSRFTAILLVYLMMIAVMVMVMLWAVPLLWQQLKIMWDYIPVAVDWYNGAGREWLSKYSESELLALDYNVIRDQVISYLQTNYQVKDAQSIIAQALSSGLSIVNTAGLVVLIPILTFYFLMSWQKRLQTWINAIPKPYRTKTLLVAKDCDSALMSFVKGQFLVMFLLGVIYAVQLQLLGLEIGFTIGMIAGIASFVPYLGFGVGIVAAIVAGLIQFGLDWIKLGMIIGAFMVGQVMEGYVLQPLLLGDKIGLSALWVIFAVLAGASMFGFVGMLLALPVAAVMNVLFCHAYRAYRDSELYQGRRQYRLFDK